MLPITATLPEITALAAVTMPSVASIAPQPSFWHCPSVPITAVSSTICRTIVRHCGS